MMHIELRIAEPVWSALRAYHFRPGKQLEALSYVWARVENAPDGIRILVPHTAPLLRFAADCFERQTGSNVRLHADVLRGMLISFAAFSYNALINVHDHWFDGRTAFSTIDDADDYAFDRYLRGTYEPLLHRLNGAVVRPIWNVALVLGRTGADARIIDTRGPADPFQLVHKITVIGEHYRHIPLRHEPLTPAAAETRLHRHKDFIPETTQASLSRFHALVVGCGGIGSILAEGLGRVGIGTLTLVDPDTLDETNLNRWQGGIPKMLGHPKAVLLGRQLRRMFPKISVNTVRRSVFDPTVEPYFDRADAIFGAVDADAPRYFLNRVALQRLLPYFDAGVAVTQVDGVLDFRTRSVTVLPGITACFECTRFELYDRAKTSEAFLDLSTAIEWRRAGYVSDQPEITAPSVYALNQRAVGLVITEFLNWVCAWRPTATLVAESWACGTIQRADRTNFPEGPDPECPACGYYAGAGSSETLPRPAAFRPENSLRKDLSALTLLEGE
jgi:molybdopterin/thiamine biosynthesis adenylyltransferase